MWDGDVSRRLSITCCVAGLLLGCSSPQPDPSAEQQILMKASRDWSQAAATGNVDAVVSYWADNAVVMMPDMPTFRGKEAIRKYVESSFKIPGFKISWEPLEAHVSASGEMGYIIERTTVTLPDQSGRPTTHRARAVSIWRKSEGGTWKNMVDISNPDPSAQPAI